MGSSFGGGVNRLSSHSDHDGGNAAFATEHPEVPIIGKAWAKRTNNQSVLLMSLLLMMHLLKAVLATTYSP